MVLSKVAPVRSVSIRFTPVRFTPLKSTLFIGLDKKLAPFSLVLVRLVPTGVPKTPPVEKMVVLSNIAVLKSAFVKSTPDKLTPRKSTLFKSRPDKFASPFVLLRLAPVGVPKSPPVEKTVVLSILAPVNKALVRLTPARLTPRKSVALKLRSVKSAPFDRVFNRLAPVVPSEKMVV